MLLELSSGNLIMLQFFKVTGEHSTAHEEKRKEGLIKHRMTETNIATLRSHEWHKVGSVGKLFANV